jgi:Alpha-tubulin suppressor and related RCC1 domain-containing proteins
MRKINLRKWICSVLVLLLAANVPAGFAQGSGYGVSSPAAPTVVKVESEEDFTVALRSDGTVWTWGQNYAGQLGNGTVSVDPRTYPEKVEGLGNVFIRDIAAGGAFVLALDSEGRIWQWGCYIPDFLSCDSHTPITSPSIVTVDGVPLIAEEINAGRAIAMARMANGEVWTWGSVEMAGWGEPSSEADYSDYSPEPSRVVDASGPLADVVQIAGGFDLAMALKSDGSVQVWGINVNRSLGVPGDSSLKLSVATKIDLPNNAIAVKIAAASYSLSSVVVTDQGVFGWSDSGSKLGLGYTDAFLPQHLPFLDGLTDIIVGYQHIYGLTAEGGVIRTTDPDYGTTALTTLNGKGIDSLFIGYKRVFALASGTVWTAGTNRYAANMMGQTRYAYNLLGNGYMGSSAGYRETPEYEPLPMLEFDALPPAAESVQLFQEGRSFQLYFNFPVGQYDKVGIKVYNSSDNLEFEDTIDRWGEGYFSGWFHPDDLELEFGHFRIDIYSYDSERDKQSEITTIHFELKKKQFMLYLFGAPDGFELGIREGDGEPIEDYEVYPGEFYDLYVFEGYDDINYILYSNTPGYSLSLNSVDSEDGTLFEVVVIPDTDPIVYDFGFEIVDGKLFADSNPYWLEPSIDAGFVEGYKAYFTDAAGNTLGEIEVEKQYISYYELNVINLEEGVDIPDGAAYLQPYMIKNGVEQPIYYKIWLEPLQLPPMTLKDQHPAADHLKLELSFDGLGDESRIAFYKIVAEPESFSQSVRTVGLIPAGQTAYHLHLSDFTLYPWERLALYLVDKSGYTSLSSNPVTVVDNMTAQFGVIDYEEHYNFYEPGNLTAPDAPTFVDEDPRSGHLAGFVRWARPAGYSYSSFVYDVYYGDLNGNIIGGLARIRQPVNAPDEVELHFDGSGLPPGAASLVIVALKNFDFEYDSTWATIMLNDVIVPSELVRSALGLAPEEPIALSHVASFIIQQLNATQPIDVTGDGLFDGRDIRILLAEITG